MVWRIEASPQPSPKTAPLNLPKGRNKKKQNTYSSPLALRALPLGKWESCDKLLHSQARGGGGLPTEGRNTKSGDRMVATLLLMDFTCVGGLPRPYKCIKISFYYFTSTFLPLMMYKPPFSVSSTRRPLRS